jgi:general secretion pathway protein L
VGQLATVRRAIAGFFSWWFSELQGMVPERLSRLLSPPVDELVLEPVGDRLVLRRRSTAGERELGAVDLDLDDPDLAKASLRPLLAGLDLRRMAVALRVPADRALRKLVDLPAAAEENLRQVLSFEMDRLTPFAADNVYYDVRVLSRDAESRRIRTELTVLPRAAVDPTVAALRRLGLQADAVALPRGSDSKRPPWRVPLSNGGDRRRIPWLPLILLALAALMLAAAVWVALDRRQQRLDALQRAVASARAEADESRRLQEEIARLSNEGDFIVDRKRERPPAVEVLNEITHALPDDTWLYRLRLIEGELQTFGYSPNASALIGLIEGSPLFASAQFRAPLTRDPRIDAEQFHIAFRVERESPQP